jgi:flagellar hook-length control protein FliK
MRVNILAAPSQPAGEMTAKTSESDNDTGAFLTEIDRVLNTGAQEEIQREDKESEQSSDASENSDLNLFLSSFLFSMQPSEIKSVPQMNLPDSSPLSTQPEGESGNASDAAVDEKENSAIASINTSVIRKPNREFELKPESITLVQNLSERALAFLALAAFSPAANSKAESYRLSGSIPNQMGTGKEMENAQAAIISLAGASDLNSDSALDLQQINSPEKVESDSAAALHNLNLHERFSSKDALRVDIEDGNLTSQDINEQAHALHDAGQGQASHFDAGETPSRFISADNKNFSADPMPSRKENSWAAFLGKLDTADLETSKEMDMGASCSDQEAARNKFPAIMSIQNKLDDADFKRSKSNGAEKFQEKLAAMTSGFERSGNVNNSAASSDPVAPSRPGDLVYQLAEKIQVQIRDGKGEIRIQLKPENLGSLEIRATSTANGVVARIAAESSSVKSYLENNLHILQQTLQDQGLKVDRLQIIVQETLNMQSSSGQSAQFGHTGSESQEREAPKSAHLIESALPIPEEEIAVDPSTFVARVRNRFYTVA